MTDEKRQKKVDEMIQKMKDSKCQFPGCKDKSFMQVALQMYRKEGENKAVPEKDASLTVPMCMFHFMCVEAAPFGVMVDKEKNESVFIGPADLVNAVDKILAAAVMSGRLKELTENKKKTDEKIAEELAK